MHAPASLTAKCSLIPRFISTILIGHVSTRHRLFSMTSLDIVDKVGSPDPDVRVLVIDDSLTIRQGLSRELQKLGLAVTEAEDGTTGLDIAAQQRFDLIITDITLPGLDGFELCRQLKSSPATKSTPVIIVSSHDTEEDIEKCFEAGAAAAY